jgi:hypothetical protein
MATISLISNKELTLQGSGEVTWGITLEEIRAKIDEVIADNSKFDKLTLKFSGTAYNNAILYAYNEYAVCGLTNSDSDAITNTSGGTGGTNLFKYGAFEIPNKTTVNLDSQSIDITDYFYKWNPHSVQNTSYSRLTVAFSSKATYKKTYKFSLSIEVTEHVNTQTVEKEATCTEPGTTKFYCNNCNTGYYDYKTPPALGHSFGTTTAAKAATCTATGNTAYKKCSRCNLYFAGDAATNATGGKSDTSSFVIAALGHSWSTTTYTWSNDGKTCTAKRVCSRNNSHTETATATITSAVKTAATCTTKGTTRYTATFGVAWASTQTKDVQDIPVKAHTSGTPVVENKIEATCTADGSYDEVVYCSVCGTELSRNKKTIPAKGHSYTTQTFEPTETSPGYTRYTCSECGHSYDVDTYRIYISAENGTITGVTNGGVYAQGTSLTLTATPNEGYNFARWSDGNTDNPRTITVTGKTTYTAIFERAWYYLWYAFKVDGVKIEGLSGYRTNGISGGVVDPNEDSWLPNSVIEVTAVGKEGYIFSHWEDGSTANPRRITLTSDMTIWAYYRRELPEITAVTITRSTDLAQVTINTPVSAGEKYIISVEVT